MLMGVWAESSFAKTKEGWLSDEACRVGVSSPGVPARLIGREKLKEGRGRGIEASELTDGERWKEAPGPRPEDAADMAKALLLESLRGGSD